MAIEADDRKIHEGLNVVEHWNGANNFLFFARQGQITSIPDHGAAFGAATLAGQAERARPEGPHAAHGGSR